jgi:hypothetical protein
MTALNKAYESGSLIEMASLASDSGIGSETDDGLNGPLDDIRTALDREMAHVQQNIIRLDSEIRDLQNSPILALSLESKLAERSGRDLLGEVIQNLKKRNVAKQRERDQLKRQLEQLDNQ